MINRIEKVYSDIESIRGSSDRVIAGFKYNYYSYLNIIDVKKRQLEHKLEDLKRARASSYDDVVKGIELKLSELKSLIRKIHKLFR